MIVIVPATSYPCLLRLGHDEFEDSVCGQLPGGPTAKPPRKKKDSMPDLEKDGWHADAVLSAAERRKKKDRDRKAQKAQELKAKRGELYCSICECKHDTANFSASSQTICTQQLHRIHSLSRIAKNQGEQSWFTEQRSNQATLKAMLRDYSAHVGHA